MTRRWVALLGALALGCGGALPAAPGARLARVEGRAVVLDAPAGLRRGQALYVLPAAGPGAPVAVVVALAADGPGRWRVAPLCLRDGAALPDGGAVRVAAGAIRLGRCWARVAGRPPSEWRPWAEAVIVKLDVGAADRAREGDLYALFGRALARGDAVAGFEFRGACRVVGVGDLTADCALVHGVGRGYGLDDWQRGGPAYPADAPAAGDALRELAAGEAGARPARSGEGRR